MTYTVQGCANTYMYMSCVYARAEIKFKKNFEALSAKTNKFLEGLPMYLSILLLP